MPLSDFVKNYLIEKLNTDTVVVGRKYGMPTTGIRPSDDCNQVSTCETIILDFNGDIYDSLVILEAFTYVRPVMKFSGLEEVRAHIDKDIEKISSFEI